MSTVLRVGPYRFFFYSRGGTEEPHIHVEAAEKSAKFWLKPVSRASSKKFRHAELAEIEQLVTEIDGFFWNAGILILDSAYEEAARKHHCELNRHQTCLLERVRDHDFYRPVSALS